MAAKSSKAKTKPAARPQTIDEVLAGTPAAQRAALERLRREIQAAAPNAEEGISYGLAAFRLHGKPLVAFGAAASHCALYLMSGSTVATHEEALRGYERSKGTIRFAANKPLPAALIRRLVKARIAELASAIKVISPGRKSKQSAKKLAAGKHTVDSVLKSLKQLSSKKYRDGMARFAIPADNALGVSVGDMRALAKKIGKDHDLAAGLWATGIYEARMMAAFVDDPAAVTPQQMDRWCADFDSWAICDTACFALFDRTPHAWKKIKQWSKRPEEFVKRAAFALLASLVVHDKQAGDEPFLRGLVLIERGANDDRNFVKKGVNWALRCIGKRNQRLHAAAIEVAQRLSASTNSASRWIGKDALRELQSPAVIKRLASRR